MDDIRIADFSSMNAAKNDDESELDQQLLELIQEQKKNGNIEKAHQLAAELSAEVGANDDEYLLDADSFKEVVMQRRLLLAFCIISSLDSLCPNPLIATITKNHFYENIQALSPQIYDDIAENTAFSYYYLCLRNNIEEPIKCIGATFAKLCGNEDNKIYRELGENLYNFFVNVVHDGIEKLEFVK